MSGLTREQSQQFESEGYIVIDKLVPDSIVDDLITEVEQTIEDAAQKARLEGKLTDLCEGHGFETRLIHLNAQTEEVYNQIHTGQLHGPALFAFLTCEEVLDAAESLVGTEIMNNGIYRLRPKLPSHPKTEVNWHQDAAYVAEDARHVLTAAFWIPLVDAGVDNGCLWVIPRAHKRGVLQHSQAKHYLDINPSMFPESEPIPVPVRKGGALVIHPWMPHCSKSHAKQVVRWSVDTRYQDPTQPTGYRWEAPFLVRSRKWPERVVRDHAEFVRIRTENIHESFS